MRTGKVLKSARRVGRGDGFTRVVTIRPAFDKRHADPSKNYGIHGADMVFTLVGPAGATYFVAYTNWYLPHVARELRSKVEPDHNPFEPMGAEVGYHSPTPQREGQESRNDACEYLDGKPCYCDSSATAGDKMMALLIAKGDEAMWAELRQWYDDQFPPIAASAKRFSNNSRRDKASLRGKK
jgi:hypothetical protein